jgi:hypothetical protein
LRFIRECHRPLEIEQVALFGKHGEASFSRPMYPQEVRLSLSFSYLVTMSAHAAPCRSGVDYPEVSLVVQVSEFLEIKFTVLSPVVLTSVSFCGDSMELHLARTVTSTDLVERREQVGKAEVSWFFYHLNGIRWPAYVSLAFNQIWRRLIHSINLQKNLLKRHD